MSQIFSVCLLSALPNRHAKYASGDRQLHSASLNVGVFYCLGT